MKKRLGVVVVCGLGIAFASCGSDTGGKPGAKPDGAADAGADVPVDTAAGVAVDAGIMPLPVLDPNGTYGGKTHAEWQAADQRHYLQLPDATGILGDTTGAYCGVGQSSASDNLGTGTDVFFIDGYGTGKFTRNCTIPSGEMIYFDLIAFMYDNSGVPEGNLTDDQLQANLRTELAGVTGLSLEIDGKSYGSRVADFAAYVTEPTPFSYTIPDTPTNLAAATGWWGSPTFSGPVPKSFCAGYGVLLAPLSAGAHTLHAVVEFNGIVNENTINLTIADVSTLGSIDGGPSVDAALPVNYCSGPASGALIDDMSGLNISLAPPSCGSPGGWTAWSPAPGIITSPTGDTSILSNCGSLCEALYSPLPANFPGTTAPLDGGPVDAGTADGGASGMRAMCIAGQTSPKQYDWSGMTLTFAYSGTVATGTGPTKISSPSLGFTTDPPPALLDASQYSGLEFWLWSSPDTASAMSAAFVVQLVDKNQLPGGGVCDPNATNGRKPCNVASAGISFSTAATSQGTGLLLDADGYELTSLASGWQLVRAPWSSFLSNPYYGGGNEKSVDPTTLAYAQFVIEQNSANGTAIPFDFCVSGLRFYK
jgi:hypothetical protein